MPRNALLCFALLLTLLTEVRSQVDGSETPSAKAPGLTPLMGTAAESRRETFIITGVPGTTIVILLAPELDSSAIVVEIPSSGRVLIIIETRQNGRTPERNPHSTGTGVPPELGTTRARSDIARRMRATPSGSGAGQQGVVPMPMHASSPMAYRAVPASRQRCTPCPSPGLVASRKLWAALAGQEM